jgi:hypothetical protein
MKDSKRVVKRGKANKGNAIKSDFIRVPDGKGGKKIIYVGDKDKTAAPAGRIIKREKIIQQPIVEPTPDPYEGVSYEEFECPECGMDRELEGDEWVCGNCGDRRDREFPEYTPAPFSDPNCDGCKGNCKEKCGIDP